MLEIILIIMLLMLLTNGCNGCITFLFKCVGAIILFVFILQLLGG